MNTKNTDYWNACHELASTTDIHTITEVVYGSNKFAQVCVLENPLLSQAHLSRLLNCLTLPDDRITILSHPNFSEEALNQLNLEQEDVSVCRFILKGDKANFKTRVAAQININRPILVRL